MNGNQHSQQICVQMKMHTRLNLTASNDSFPYICRQEFLVMSHKFLHFVASFGGPNGLNFLRTYLARLVDDVFLSTRLHPGLDTTIR
jgi:hypothetical protein